MSLSTFLKSAAGTCHFCNQKAGILSREHPECRRTYQAGWDEMVRLAGGAAGSHEFHANSLRVALTEIARRSYGDASTVARALEKGSETRRSRREHHARRGNQTPEVPGAAGTEPEQCPRPGNGTTEPDVQSEAPVVDPGRHHHCRRRSPSPEKIFSGSPEGRVRVGGIVHTGVHTSVVKAAVIREIAEGVVPQGQK